MSCCKITQGYILIRKRTIGGARNEARKKKIMRLFKGEILVKDGI